MDNLTQLFFVLSQCNVLFSARRHKLQLFAGFRRVVVVIFPSADEWKRRLLQREMSDGEHIPETALLKLQGLTYLLHFGEKGFQLQLHTGMSIYCLYVIFLFLFRYSIDVVFVFLPSVSCSLPEPQPDLMEELQYAELPQEQAQILLMQYKEEAHRLLPPVIKPDKKPRWTKRRRHFLSPPPSNRKQWGAVHGWHETQLIFYFIY